MNRLILAFALLFIGVQLYGQQNISLIGQLGYTEDASDIWGYVAPDSTEYALVGVRNGLSVVSLANPAAPVEVDFVPGASSTWRDIKVWGNYAYVVADQGADGLAVIDLSGLPNSVSNTFWQPTITINGVSGTLTQSHNIYIDENGIGYLAGSNLNAGGMVFLDLNTPTGIPNYIGAGPARYSHDVFVRGDTMWSSDINAGWFSVVDVSNKANPVELATQNTPFNFTHNAWLSDDGNTLYTTDEQSNAPVASYDVSDLSDIKKLDEFRPPATVGAGVIPHNTHTKGDFQVVSYYTDGIVVIDATMPDWLVQAGQYDTYGGPDGGFNGCWGAYPFLPSGLILASDINTGLYVLSPTYQRACYLDGNVTDAANSNVLDGVTVSFDTEPVTASTDLAGDYKSGYGTAGTFDITYSLPGYVSQTIAVTLTAGQITTQDVALVKLPSIQLTGQIIRADNGNPVPGGVVEFVGNGLLESATADASGNFTIPQLVIGDYEAFGGKWGYRTKLVPTATYNSGNNSVVIELDEGYMDDFALDLGWTVSGNATTGIWERGVPIGITVYGFGITPGADDQADLGMKCYVTGNSGDLTGGSVSGVTTLTSPSFDATLYNDPEVSYRPWFFSATQQGGGTAQRLKIYLDDGTNQVLIEELDYTLGVTANWRNISNHRIADFMTPTNAMTLVVETSDPFANNVTEAGIDIFEVVDLVASVSDLNDAGISMSVYPNPSKEEFTLNYNFAENKGQKTVKVFNALGQLEEEVAIDTLVGEIAIGKNLSPGVYFIQLESDQIKYEALKVIKIN